MLDELEGLARERRRSELREFLAQVTGDGQIETNIESGLRSSRMREHS